MIRTARSAVFALAASLSAFVIAAPLSADGHEEPAPAPLTTLMPEDEGARAFQERFGYSQAVIHGDTVYLSGLILGPPQEGETREESYDRSFQYLGSILERAGSSWDDVIDIISFHRDIPTSLPALAEVKGRYIKAPYPTWTVIGTNGLYTDEGELEIKITARLTPPATPKPAKTPEFLPLQGSSTPFSEAVQVGDTLYLAGKLGTAADGSGLVPGGITAETARAMERIGETLAQYDLTHDAVFKCTVFLADMEDFAKFNAVYRTFFKQGRYPARSTVAVKGLALDAAIEVECLAHGP
ncbi:MAG: Rid family hydrolase [Pseudomonadota bacterium]